MIPEKEMPQGILSDDELAVMERINEKFANYGSVEISNYSHKEKGYNSTEKGEIISYSYAKDIELN
ncbi:MAG: SocA family protein [Lachnospiraceae bacterium]|nr:SocA family protein [Lachnospiraceae bacterium]